MTIGGFLLGAVVATAVLLGSRWLIQRLTQGMYHSIVGKKIGWRLVDACDGPVRHLELRRTEVGRKEQWIKIHDQAELYLVNEVISKYLKQSRGKSECRPERRS